MTSRRAFVTGGMAMAALRPDIAAAAPTPPSGETGWLLMDAESGAVLDSRAIDTGFIPASTTKSVTALLTLSTLPPTTRFLTRIHATGPLRNGVLEGDLTLVGGGDPALDTGDLAQLAKALRAKGLRRVAGRFLVAAIDGPDEPVLNEQQPLQASYNPAIGGLCLNFNRVLLRWRRQGNRHRLAAIAHSDNRSVSARSVDFKASRSASAPRHRMDGDREIWTLPARDLHRDGERWMPIRNPASYAGAVFRSLCDEAGIVLPLAERTDNVPTDPPLALHRSDVVFALTTKMMKYSTNLTAEMLGIAAARRIGGIPRMIEDAAATSVDWLRREGGIDGPLTLANHSGLSSASRITPRQMADTLRLGYRRFGTGYIGMHTKGELRGNRNGLPPYRFWAKTGTMNYVRSLAGFLEVDGRRAIFVIFHMNARNRAALDAAYTPYDERRPPGSGRWLRRALDHENALLRGWLSAGLR